MHSAPKICSLFFALLIVAPAALSQTTDNSSLLTAKTSSLSADTSAASCAPPKYNCARSDLAPTRNLNPPPDFNAGKNAIVTPSDFNLPIVRVTDKTTYENRTFTETPGGSNTANIFNTNDTYLVVNDVSGWSYPLSFDPSNMQVLNSKTWNVGGNQVRWSGASSFSRSNPNVLYTVMNSTSIPGATPNSTTLYSVTLAGTTSITGQAKAIYDFANCAGMAQPYNTGHGIWHAILTVSANDQRFSTAFSNNKGGQNTGTDVTVYDAPSGQCYHYDTAKAQLCTSKGCQPMSLPDKFTIHEVYMSFDGQYLRVVSENCIQGGCNEGSNTNPYYWQIGTTNVVRCFSPTGGANCNGHQAEGYSHIYNAIGWPEIAKRSFTDPLSYIAINQGPDLTPGTDFHVSNNAADVNDTYPLWITNVQNVHTDFHGVGCEKTGNIYEGCKFPGPLYGEIFGIAQNGSYIRAAHSYNSGASKYFNCTNTIGAVSQSGKFFAWTSDWLRTLGQDRKGRSRCDIFIVNLAAAQGAKN